MNDQLSKLFFPHDNKIEHSKALDGLRGIAVLVVLLSHSSNHNILFYEYLNFQGWGKVGVYLFFILSAYLLDRQIALALMSGKASKRYWINYFVRRFLRIYPLFAISLILHGVLSLLGLKTAIDRIIDIPLHLLLLKGESIFWSIPVEFKYYFLSPLIMLFCHKYLKWNLKKTLISIFLLILSSLAIQSVLFLPPISTYRYFPFFLTGALISIVELLQKKSFIHQTQYSNIIEIVGLLCLSIISLTIPYYFKLIFNADISFHHPMIYIPYAALWGAILIAAKHGSGIIRAFFEIKMLRFLGTISFSMYLFHIPILEALATNIIDIPEHFKIYVFFILTTIISSISYVFLERPLSTFKIYHKPLGVIIPH